jgi:signal transduction histidine kinase
VRGDHELLRRAIENILQNAVRYNPDGSPLEVTLKRDRDSARLSVRDFGPGVPDELLRKIFQPFFASRIVWKRSNRSRPP